MNLFRDEDAPVPKIDTMERWPHQTFAFNAVLNCMDRGVKRICVTSPTGGGKSLIIADLCREFLRSGWGVSVFTNRKMLIEQMSRGLDEFGFDFGIRAAGHVGDAGQRLQLSSIQTEHSRVTKRGHWEVHDCRAFIVDEAHLNENDQANEVYKPYLDRGAFKIGFTATPLDLKGGYDELVIAGTVPELQECGALVTAIHYGCTEPDLRNIKKVPIGEELTEKQNIKLIMAPGIHGRVIEWFRKLNPHGLPSIGFAPGVGESVGFAEAFENAGIPAAHIDGDRIWIRGEEFPSTEERRDELLALSKLGRIRIIWNRFVLREAIDMPWLRHGIMATVFGSVQSYLQSGGRLLRSHRDSGKKSVTIQDHGGNWWRHGSLNKDRHWRLTDTARIVANERVDNLTGEVGDGEPKLPKEPEPFLCNRCQGVMLLRQVMDHENFTARCPHCGNMMDFRRRSRPTVQSDGDLVEHPGNVFRPRRVERRPDTHVKWRKYFFAARNSANRMTFAQAAGKFLIDNHYSPPRDLPLMPYSNYDWFLPVASVPFSRLRPDEK